MNVRVAAIRLWILVFVAFPVTLFASNTTPTDYQRASIEEREDQVWKSLARASQFSDVSHASSPRCEDLHSPQALTTPDPLFAPTRDRSRVKVSFIIGTDGRVHSPLILESAGPMGDRNVLRAVRTWRFRPATCNGVPTETEGKVEFSSR